MQSLELSYVKMDTIFGTDMPVKAIQTFTVAWFFPWACSAWIKWTTHILERRSWRNRLYSTRTNESDHILFRSETRGLAKAERQPAA